MTEYQLDIIIPVWNSPVEVRAALALFAADSPQARLVMVSNGSERETEAILHEFAEALDDRALLLSSEKNIGTVAALNRGLSRSTAPFILVTNPFVRIAHDWFEEVQSVFEQFADAGAVSLRTRQGVTIEADHGSFTAMVIRRELFLRAAGFDEQMDGSSWALRDFARRATACGYRTFSLYSRQLRLEKQQELGSQTRRDLKAEAARHLYAERWGEPATYALHCGDSLPCENSSAFTAILLEAARQGNNVTVIAANCIGRSLEQEGVAALHENLSLRIMPRFFAHRSLRKALAGVVSSAPDALLVTADSTLSATLKNMSFAEFSARLALRREKYYHGGVHA